MPAFMVSRYFVALAIAVQLQSTTTGLLNQSRLVAPNRATELDTDPLNPLPISGNIDNDVVKPGTKLRVLFVGDSITQGKFSDSDGGDGNGFRLRFRDDLHRDHVVFAGTEIQENGNMSDGYFAAWPGKTIEYISTNVDASLEQRPNVILLHAGTNDLNPDRAISTEGNDPIKASERLGDLVDKLVAMCPDAAVLVAMIINTCDPAQSSATTIFQSLIPGITRRHLDEGKHVLAVNLSSFPTGELRDCIHPTNRGYALLGDYWANALTQIPKQWIQAPKDSDPVRSPAKMNRPLYGFWGLIPPVLALQRLRI